jgi:Leucine-rich repeat (LRR) protein
MDRPGPAPQRDTTETRPPIADGGGGSYPELARQAEAARQYFYDCALKPAEIAISALSLSASLEDRKRVANPISGDKWRQWKATDKDIEDTPRSPEVRRVSLHGCENITDKSLKMLAAKFPNLEELDLGMTSTTAEGLKSLKDLPKLKKLGFSFSPKLDDACLKEIGAVKSLESLRLIDCPKVTSEGVAHLRNLKDLESLVLASTGIDDSALKTIKGLTKLTELHLGGDKKITDVGLAELKDMKQLRSLALWGTKTTDKGLAELKGLGQLTELRLSNTAITDAGLDQLKGMKKLFLLDLANTKVSDAGMERLKDLSDLQLLNLARTKITDAGLKHIKELPLLSSLDLKKTAVTDKAVETLKYMTNLTLLYAEGTKIGPKGLKELREFRPGVTVYSD